MKNSKPLGMMFLKRKLALILSVFIFISCILPSSARADSMSIIVNTGKSNINHGDTAINTLTDWSITDATTGKIMTLSQFVEKGGTITINNADVANNPITPQLTAHVNIAFGYKGSKTKVYKPLYILNNTVADDSAAKSTHNLKTTYEKEEANKPNNSTVHDFVNNGSYVSSTTSRTEIEQNRTNFSGGKVVEIMRTSFPTQYREGDKVEPYGLAVRLSKDGKVSDWIDGSQFANVGVKLEPATALKNQIAYLTDGTGKRTNITQIWVYKKPDQNTQVTPLPKDSSRQPGESFKITQGVSNRYMMDREQTNPDQFSIYSPPRAVGYRVGDTVKWDGLILVLNGKLLRSEQEIKGAGVSSDIQTFQDRKATNSALKNGDLLAYAKKSDKSPLETTDKYWVFKHGSDEIVQSIIVTNAKYGIETKISVENIGNIGSGAEAVLSSDLGDLTEYIKNRITVNLNEEVTEEHFSTGKEMPAPTAFGISTDVDTSTPGVKECVIVVTYGGAPIKKIYCTVDVLDENGSRVDTVSDDQVTDDVPQNDVDKAQTADELAETVVGEEGVKALKDAGYTFEMETIGEVDGKCQAKRLIVKDKDGNVVKDMLLDGSLEQEDKKIDDEARDQIIKDSKLEETNPGNRFTRPGEGRPVEQPSPSGGNAPPSGGNSGGAGSNMPPSGGNSGGAGSNMPPSGGSSGGSGTIMPPSDQPTENAPTEGQETSEQPAETPEQSAETPEESTENPTDAQTETPQQPEQPQNPGTAPPASGGSSGGSSGGQSGGQSGESTGEGSTSPLDKTPNPLEEFNPGPGLTPTPEQPPGETMPVEGPELKGEENVTDDNVAPPTNEGEVSAENAEGDIVPPEGENAPTAPPNSGGENVPAPTPPANEGENVPGNNPPTNEGENVPAPTPPANEGENVPAPTPSEEGDNNNIPNETVPPEVSPKPTQPEDDKPVSESTSVTVALVDKFGQRVPLAGVTVSAGDQEGVTFTGGLRTFYLNKAGRIDTSVKELPTGWTLIDPPVRNISVVQNKDTVVEFKIDNPNYNPNGEPAENIEKEAPVNKEADEFNKDLSNAVASEALKNPEDRDQEYIDKLNDIVDDLKSSNKTPEDFKKASEAINELIKDTAKKNDNKVNGNTDESNQEKGNPFEEFFKKLLEGSKKPEFAGETDTKDNKSGTVDKKDENNKPSIPQDGSNASNSADNSLDDLLDKVQKEQNSPITNNLDHAKVTLTVGSNKMSLLDEKGNPTGEGVRELDAEPENRNGHIYLPLRHIAEALGCDVDWDQDKQEAIIKEGDRTFRVRALDNSWYCEQDPKLQGVLSPSLYRKEVQGGDRLMLPMRAIGNMLGYSVGNNKDEKADISWTQTKGGPVSVVIDIQGHKNKKLGEQNTQLRDIGKQLSQYGLAIHMSGDQLAELGFTKRGNKAYGTIKGIEFEFKQDNGKYTFVTHRNK